MEASENACRNRFQFHKGITLLRLLSRPMRFLTKTIVWAAFVMERTRCCLW